MTKHESKKSISVIIVSWNAKEYLMQCIASISVNKCAHQIEIIVVDNGSTDGSPEFVAQKYPHVHLIRKRENLGFAKANNIGISASTGEYLCFVNSDAEVLPGCIDNLVEYCEEHQDVGLVGPRIIGGDGRLQRSCRGFPSIWNVLCRALALDSMFPSLKIFTGYSLTSWSHNSLREVDIITGCFWLSHKKALDDVGVLDESFFIYGEDKDWCKRFWSAGWPVVFVPTAEAIHYGGGSSSNAPIRFFIEKQKANFYYWGKHHSGFEGSLYYMITFTHMILRCAGYSLGLLIWPQNPNWRYKVLRSWACIRWMVSEKKT